MSWLASELQPWSSDYDERSTRERIEAQKEQAHWDTCLTDGLDELPLDEEEDDEDS